MTAALHDATLAVCALAGLLTWAFQGVGPSAEAEAAVAHAPPERVASLKNALLFGGETPRCAFYCGAKVRAASYAPLMLELLKALDDPAAGALVLQSPHNVYACKPSSVAAVLERFPTVTLVAGHSIGGLWAAEFCRDLHAAGKWPTRGLDFFWLGVHSKTLSLASFKAVPFRRVGWSCASEDVTMRRACASGEDFAGYVRRVAAEQLPANATCYVILGGNHAQYGSYGAPGYAQGMIYNELPATISPEAQRAIVAAALAEVATGAIASRK